VGENEGEEEEGGDNAVVALSAESLEGAWHAVILARMVGSSDSGRPLMPQVRGQAWGTRCVGQPPIDIPRQSPFD
jgi:hypothetical protein